MKKENQKTFILMMFILIFSSTLLAQDPVVNEAQADTTKLTQQDEESKQKKDKKRKDSFKVYVGTNFNKLNLSSDEYGNTVGIGWNLGASYKRGKFFYWELGVRYNNSVYNLDDATKPIDASSLVDGIFSSRNIDIPASLGINLLSATDRIVGLRVFVSAVPSFALGVGGNDLDISMDNINTFNFYGQAGVGVDVFFLFIELGANYGFQDYFKNHSPSNPYQAYLNLGFRF
jgi:hypothetical protein